MRWDEIEPALDTTYRLLNDSDKGTTSPDAVCGALGHPSGDERTIRALGLLYDQGYIDGITYDETPAPVVVRPTEKGLKYTSGWPSERGGEVELLLRLLDERIQDETIPEEERGKLRKVRDAFAGLGRDIAVGVLSAYVSKQTGVGDGS